MFEVLLSKEYMFQAPVNVLHAVVDQVQRAK